MEINELKQQGREGLRFTGQREGKSEKGPPLGGNRKERDAKRRTSEGVQGRRNPSSLRASSCRLRPALPSANWLQHIAADAHSNIIATRRTQSRFPGSAGSKSWSAEIATGMASCFHTTRPAPGSDVGVRVWRRPDRRSASNRTGCSSSHTTALARSAQAGKLLEEWRSADPLCSHRPNGCAGRHGIILVPVSAADRCCEAPRNRLTNGISFEQHTAGVLPGDGRPVSTWVQLILLPVATALPPLGHKVVDAAFAVSHHSASNF